MREEQVVLMDYLEALRKSLIIAGGSWLVAFFFLYGYAEKLFSWIATPVKSALPAGSSLVFLSATEPFFTYLLLTAMAALVVALPIILWQVWAFAVSGLGLRGKGLGFFFVAASCLAFLAGAYLGFRHVFPLIISVLVRFGTEAGGIDAMLSMGDYLSLALKMMLAFGLVFDLPVAMIVLTRLGVVDGQWFAARRKYTLIVAFVFGAVITPGPDVLSQASIAVPFLILYEVGILGARMFRKKAGQKSEQNLAATETSEKTGSEHVETI